MEIEQQEEDLTPERFIAMLGERGLSAYQHTARRHDVAYPYTVHLIDVKKDGKVLATYDTRVIQYFTEDHMAKELDELVSKIHDGKIDEKGDYEVSYATSYICTTIWIECKSDAKYYMDDTAVLTPKQALSLLKWLEQERSRLEQLAKEQE